jgi:hypothetical protein
MRLDDEPLETPADSVVREMFQYAAEAQQEKIHALLHPEAIVVPIHHPERVVRSADFPDYVREQTMWATYRQAHADDIDEVAPGRFLVRGNVRWSSRAGGFTDTTVFWAVVVRDGLVYRLKGCQRRDDAVASLEADDWRPSPV